MNRIAHPLLAAILACAALAGCDDDANQTDAAVVDMTPVGDVAPDPDMPPAVDMAPNLDMAVDARVDAAIDAEVDAVIDAEVDAVIDAEVDAVPICNPGPERCNGLDDDCDELIDEGYGVDDVCSAGIGACRAVARKTCTEDGSATFCPAEVGAPAPVEACDGLDNDCDGTVDEDFDLDGDRAPACGFDACGEDCPLGDAEQCRLVCDLNDCNDERPTTGPLAADACGDGIDQNCDGIDASCSVAVGRLNRLEITTPDNVVCPDNNGDGVPDNALNLIGAIANEGLGDAVANRGLNLFLSAAGLQPPGEVGIFDLAVLTASVDGGNFSLDESALDEQGRPAILFPRARVRDHELRTEPGVFALDVPVVAGVELRLAFSNAEIRGRVSVDDADGFTLEDGVLWGAVTEVDLQAALDGLEAGCDAQDPPPAFCGPLRQFRPILPNLLNLDQDLDGDGESESYSACLLIGAEPAVLNDWPPEE